MRTKFAARAVSWTALSLAVLLLCVNMRGLYAGAVDLQSPLYTAGWDATPFDRRFAELDRRDLDPSEAIAQFEDLKHSPGDELSKAQALLALVAKSFLHLPSTYWISVWDNWLLWSLEAQPHYLRRSQDPDLLWERGGGFCNQAVLIFTAKAAELGLEARSIYLGGHVVAEVKAGTRWYAADPDLGVFWPEDFASIQKWRPEKIIQEMVKAGAPAEIAPRFAEVYVNPLAVNVKKHPVDETLFLIERISQYARWFFPIALGSMALLSLARGSKRY